MEDTTERRKRPRTSSRRRTYSRSPAEAAESGDTWNRAGSVCCY